MMDGPMNASAQRRHSPSSTRLPSTRISRQSSDSAACATIRFKPTDLPAPGSPAASRFRSASPTGPAWPRSSMPRSTGCQIDNDCTALTGPAARCGTSNLPSGDVTGVVAASGSRRITSTTTSAENRRSRVTRTSRAKHAARSRSVSSAMSSADTPTGQHNHTRSPTAVGTRATVTGNRPERRDSRSSWNAARSRARVTMHPTPRQPAPGPPPPQQPHDENDREDVCPQWTDLLLP